MTHIYSHYTLTTPDSPVEHVEGLYFHHSIFVQPKKMFYLEGFADAALKGFIISKPVVTMRTGFGLRPRPTGRPVTGCPLYDAQLTDVDTATYPP